MKKRLPLFVLVLSLSLIFAAANARGAEIKSAIELSNGYRVDQLDWNIAGNLAGTNPNVLSELTWRDIEIYQVNLGLKALINEGFYVRGALGYGWIFDGSNQDSDFQGNNRTGEFSRSNNGTEDSHVVDASFGMGYQFTLISGRLRFIPLLGYSYNQQNLTITDGFQTISTPGVTPPVGPFPGLASTYKTEWFGPWLGLDLIVPVNEKITLSGSFEYHWASYEAEANWNLRRDFAHPTSFEHSADGTGLVLSLGGRYAFSDRWSLALTMNYQKLSTDPGIDRVYLVNGAISETRLNEVNWESFAILIGITYRFHIEWPLSNSI